MVPSETPTRTSTKLRPPREENFSTAPATLSVDNSARWPSGAGPGVQSEALRRSSANANASLSRSMISAESLPILRSRRTVGRDPNP